jgi:undecaprenyl-diphosphatase
VRAIILFGLGAALVRTTAPWPGVRRLAGPCAVALVVAIAFDRLYLSTHWATDVIGGLLLGGTALAAALAVRTRGRRDPAP